MVMVANARLSFDGYVTQQNQLWPASTEFPDHALVIINDRKMYIRDKLNYFQTHRVHQPQA